MKQSHMFWVFFWDADGYKMMGSDGTQIHNDCKMIGTVIRRVLACHPKRAVRCQIVKMDENRKYSDNPKDFLQIREFSL